MNAIGKPFNPNRGTSNAPTSRPPQLETRYDIASPLCLLVYEGIAEAAIHGDCSTSHNRNMRSSQTSAGSLPRVHAAKTAAPSNHSDAETATHPATVTNSTNRKARRSRDLSSSASSHVRLMDEE